MVCFLICMRIGISTSFNYKLPFPENIRAIADAGFKFISVGGNVRHSHYNTPEGRRARLLEYSGKFGLEIDSIHAPYDPTCDLTQTQDIFAQNAVIEIKRSITAASELGVKKLIVHLSAFRPRKLSERMARIKLTVPEIVKFAGEKQVQIALENLDSDSEVLFKYAMDLFESENLKFCYDNGHEMLYNESMDLLKKYSGRLAVMHIHDNDGERDLHLIPFEGKLDFPALAGQLNKLERIPDITLECEMENSNYATAEKFLEAAYNKGMQFIEMLKR
ncbi:MAG: sugar phosphate isomerase/epimerase [candidate division Zixibacteria bacterium]|nr:sugar phosphate isomerase/epimerase [candidate division Zixibacteria bacterium]NIS45925.1 sugar phosphate isomerase/epimerase [candidate division Zixibacteria bacterium]NIT51822.1 sugar phosphate isomerase/epimerase [candidate division Zixibacteria bacterium]NIV06092.1 TIM barrel protein [candidate division Zixibacteria bacterium]NIW39695.1 TIM barrel protein [candidate division Zixibacteria bacterium]